MWGFTSSPLVVDDVVIVVAAAGKLAAYDLATGEPRWFGPAGGGSYSSPQLATIDGVAQIVLLGGSGATSVAPADRHGAVGARTGRGGDDRAAGGHRRRRRAHHRRVDERRRRHSRACPSRTRGAQVDGEGALDVERPEAVLQRLRRPQRLRLRLRRQHPRRASISPTASRKWKGGRYGNGQLVLLARSGSAARARPRKASWRWSRRRRISSRRSHASRRSKARPGIIRCSSATCCWCATTTRWPRSGCRWPAADTRRPRIAHNTRVMFPVMVPPARCGCTRTPCSTCSPTPAASACSCWQRRRLGDTIDTHARWICRRRRDSRRGDRQQGLLLARGSARDAGALERPGVPPRRQDDRRRR